MRARTAVTALALMTAAALAATTAPASATDTTPTAGAAVQDDSIWGAPSPTGIAAAVTDALTPLSDSIWG